MQTPRSGPGNHVLHCKPPTPRCNTPTASEGRRERAQLRKVRVGGAGVWRYGGQALFLQKSQRH